jgi:hypothetical protein
MPIGGARHAFANHSQARGFAEIIGFAVTWTSLLRCNVMIA